MTARAAFGQAGLQSPSDHLNYLQGERELIVMGKDKNAQAQTKMDQFTKPSSSSRGNGEATTPVGPTDTLAGTETILSAIRESREAVERKVEEVRVDVSLLRHDLRGVAERVTEAESRISTAEDEIVTLRSQVNQLLKSSAILEDRAEDAENRSRRNNLRLVGIPEGVDTQDLAQLIEDWFLSWVTGEALSKNFVVERAHRSLMARPPPGAPPRPIITRILNFRDRDMILRAARSSQDLQFQNSRIMIFPDYSRAVQMRRRSFEEVKQKLRAMNIQYMLLFPARLKIIHQSKTFFFDSPNQAWEWATETPNLPKLGGDGVSRTNRGGLMRGGTRRPAGGRRQSSRQRRTNTSRTRSTDRGGQVGDPESISQTTDISATPNIFRGESEEES